MSGTGILGSEKLCERAIPSISRAVGRCRDDDHLPRLLVLATNCVRASFGEDLMDPVLIPLAISGRGCPGG